MMILNILFNKQRLVLISLPPTHLSLPNYSYEFCPTEAKASGTVIYTLNYLTYKTRNYLDISKSFDLESTFIETWNPKKTYTTSARTTGVFFSCSERY